ncbi:MAG: SH3 domain-containing protein [Rubripirellula sp.]
MLPIRRVAPIRLIHLTLIAGCVLTQGFSQSIQAENTALVAQSDLSFEPYSVYVADENAHARCGPASDYYRTDPLRQGQELEVYAETDDGWLGIRPPAKSFCWVPADTVEMANTKEDGTVTEDRTVAWIGTHLGRARTYRWQVQLAKGEPVSVIGRSEREGPDGPQMWYRIVPPSGEYRWVHRDDIVTSSEELVELMRNQRSEPEVKVFPKDSPRNKPEARAASSRSRSDDTNVASSRQGRRNDAEGTTERRAADEPDERQPSRSTVASSEGDSILENDEQMVGSGLKDDWKPNEQAVRTSPQRDAVSSVDYMGRPKLLEIDAAPSAPSSREEAGDANWVAGTTRGQSNATTGDPGTPNALAVSQSGLPNPSPAGSIMQTSAQLPVAGSTLQSPIASMPKRMTVVSSERIAQVEVESRNADIDRLSLIFSRLMASQASAAETEPVARAARGLASSGQDPVATGRARLLAERVEQYRRVANRRDGDAVIRSNHAPVIPASHSVTVPTGNAGPLYNGSPQAATTSQASSQTGYLVQVYSARSNSPPFALTDHSGRTIAYVTPSPGVNLRSHLNSRVNIFGNRGYLTGLNTPHILATQAVRTQE